MHKTSIVVAIAGALMFAGAILQVPSIVRRRGRAPWRGAAISVAALAVYGLLLLEGVVLNGTILSAALVWCIAAAIWVGWWLNRRDTAKRARQAV
jgi:hypothetical protein